MVSLNKEREEAGKSTSFGLNTSWSGLEFVRLIHSLETLSSRRKIPPGLCLKLPGFCLSSEGEEEASHLGSSPFLLSSHGPAPHCERSLKGQLDTSRKIMEP